MVNPLSTIDRLRVNDLPPTTSAISAIHPMTTFTASLETSKWLKVDR
jgi:hypothetical protein